MACGLLAAIAISAAPSAHADNPATAGTSNGQVLTISIDSPTAGQVIGAGQIVVSGRVALGALPTATSVLYLDRIGVGFLGGSTGCGDDTWPSSQAPLKPGVWFGRTPSCNLKAFLALNQRLSSMAAIQAGTVSLDVDPVAPGIQNLTEASDDRDGNGVLDIEQGMLVSSGFVTFLPSFTGMLRSVSDTFASVPATQQRLAFVLSDGRFLECTGRNNPYGLTGSQCVRARADFAKLREAGIRINTFTFSCDPNEALATIAAETGGRCTPTSNFTTDFDLVRQARPAGLHKVDIRIDGGPVQTATLDAAGHFSALLDAAPGPHSIAATVTADDGSTAVATLATQLVNTAVEPFAFPARSGVLPDRLVESNQIVVRGNTVPVVAAIDAGEYRVNDGAYRSAPSLVNAGDRIQLRLQPSIINEAEAAMTLSLGAATGRFVLTTRFDDSLDALYFAPKLDVPGGVYVCSDPLTVSGIDVAIPFLLRGPVTLSPKTAFFSRPTLTNGDTVRACMLSSMEGGATQSGEISAGGLTAGFEVRTIVDSTPDAFDFIDLDVPLLTVREPRTATITVRGINVPVPISISGGRFAAYSINGGPFGTAPAQVRNGDTVTVRNRLPILDKPLLPIREEMTVSIGGVRDRWSLRLTLAP